MFQCCQILIAKLMYIHVLPIYKSCVNLSVYVYTKQHAQTCMPPPPPPPKKNHLNNSGYNFCSKCNLIHHIHIFVKRVTFTLTSCPYMYNKYKVQMLHINYMCL